MQELFPELLLLSAQSGCGFVIITKTYHFFYKVMTGELIYVIIKNNGEIIVKKI